MKKIENDQNGNPRFQFGAELISIGDVLLTNKNGNKYAVATIKFVDVKKNEQVVSAMVYEGNLTHKDADFVVGREYLTTAVITERDGKPSVIMQMSHLPYRGELATADMFGVVEDAFVVSKTPVNAHAEIAS